MITLVYIVMLLCFLAVIAKLSLLKWQKSLVYGVLFFIFAWLMIPRSINSSMNEVESYLSSATARQYVAILVTMECAIAIAFAFRRWSEEPPQKRPTRWSEMKQQLLLPIWWVQKHYVTLLILPTLFFLQTRLVYALPGVDFRVPALLVGVGSLLLFPLGALLFKWLLPLRSMREELVLILSILLCISALLSTITEVMVFAPSHAVETPYGVYLLALGIFALLFAVGLVRELTKNHKQKTEK